MAKIIVIGASGYIGRSLLEQAIAAGCAWGTSSSSARHLVHLRLEAPEVFDYKQIDPGDVVFVTAAISAPDICAREKDRAWNVNVTGTSTFIKNVLSRQARIVFFSSDTIYGERSEPFDENSHCAPAGEYAEMKRAVELNFAGEENFKTIRLSYVFSSGDKFTKYLVDCAQKNELADIFHPFLRAIVYRADVVAGALAIAKRWNDFPERVINFGGPQVLSRIEYAENLRGACLPDLRFKVTEPDSAFFQNRPRVIAMTSQILARLLDRPQRSLQEAALLEFASLT